MASHWSVICLEVLALLCCLAGREAEAQKGQPHISPPNFALYPQKPQPQDPGHVSPPSFPQKPSDPQKPQMPSYPQQPPMPPYPQQPQMPPYSQHPQTPSLPHNPQKPSYPQQPPMPSYPQQPQMPSYPQQPQKPSYPQQPPMPSYPQQPQTPSLPQHPQTAQIFWDDSKPQYPQPQLPSKPQIPPPQYPQPQIPSKPQIPHPQYPQPQIPSKPQNPQPQYPRPQIPSKPQNPQPQYPRPQIPSKPQNPQPQYPQPQIPSKPQNPQPQYPQPQIPSKPQNPQPQYPRPQIPSKPQNPQPQYPQPQIPSKPQNPQPQYPQPQTPSMPHTATKKYPFSDDTKTQRPQTPSFPAKRPQIPTVPSPKSCDVPSASRVPCGAPDISATDCEARDCCFSGQACYFGSGVTVQCTKDGQFIVVVAKDVTLPHIDLDTISLLGGGPGCTHADSNSLFAIYYFPVTACGSVVMEEPGVIIYENRMTSSYEVGVGPLGAITRDSSYELLFQCRYIGTSVETLVVEVLPLDNPPLPVAALGPIRVHLRLANGECSTKGCNEVDVAYTSYYEDTDYPVTKILRDPVYVEVLLLEKTDPNLVLTLGRCWATIGPNPHTLPQWDILINGCPYTDDRYLSMLVPVDASSGLEFPTHYRRFIFKMFTFVDTNSMEPMRENIYIHCSTAVCVPGQGVSCDPSCHTKGKRDTEAAEQRRVEPKVVVSSGEVIMTAPQA